MRRRVARVVQRGLFVLGLALVLWMPVSCFVTLEASTRRLLADVHSMTVGVEYLSGDVPPQILYESGLRTKRVVFGFRDGTIIPTGWRHYGHRFTEQIVRVPLWLLAFICLAWPVTSFIIARRRHKRGFPVELAPSSGVGSGPPLPPGEGGGGGREATG